LLLGILPQNNLFVVSIDVDMFSRVNKLLSLAFIGTRELKRSLELVPKEKRIFQFIYSITKDRKMNRTPI